jgi:ABC-2 type transport system permease protein
MAVYKRTYKGYDGPLTGPVWRFLVLQRYAFRAVFKSRLLDIAYLGCFVAPIFVICLLYLNQNATVLALVRQNVGFVKVNGSFFMNFLTFQSVLAGLLTAFVAPTLVAPDLVNGALSLYLSRPFSKAEYILGKGSVIAAVAGSITLLPTMLIFLVQSSLLGWNWMMDNIYLANATLLTCLALLAVLTLLGLAMSALVRWKIVAGALILAVFAIGKGFAAMIDSVMRTTNGDYIDLQHLLNTVAMDLFHTTPPAQEDIPVAAAWATLIGACALMLFILNRKLRVCEVAA